jgi:hypothetical protein
MKYIMDHSMELEFKLKQSYENTRTVVHTTNAVTLMEILEEFQMFLEGCGFQIDGTLDVVPDEEFYGTNTSTDYTLD